MPNTGEKICSENQNTYFIFKNLSSENPAVYGIMCKNMVQSDRPQMTI
jgi:hypothetical protein